MKLDELIVRLSALPSADRDWLLAALSSQAREQLLQLTRAELGATAPPLAAEPAAAEGASPPSSAALIAKLAKIPVGTLVEVLGDEPIWLTAAVLRVAEWPWRAQLLQRLPHVAMCLCPPLDPAAPTTEPFTRLLLERVAAKTSSFPLPSGQRFETLLQKLVARRRKASWHSMEQGAQP